MTRSHLLAGRFSAATQLSPKALRLYAEQGLLVPAHVDPATGYRYYAAEQVQRARLIVRLRQLGLPVARVAALLDLVPEARLIELRSWLEAQTERLAGHTELVEGFARQLEGGDPVLAAKVAVRDVPSQKLLSRQRHIVVDAIDAFMDEAQADIRAHLRASGVSADGPMSVHFHETVTRDSEGLVEVAVAYAGSVEPAGDLRIRLQPARREVFMPVPAGHEAFPLVLRVYDTLEAWLDGRPDLLRCDSPCEIYPGSGGALFDVAYPVSM